MSQVTTAARQSSTGKTRREGQVGLGAGDERREKAAGSGE